MASGTLALYEKLMRSLCEAQDDILDAEQAEANAVFPEEAEEAGTMYGEALTRRDNAIEAIYRVVAAWAS